MLEGKALRYTDVSLTGYEMDKAWRDIFSKMLDKTGKKQSDIGCIVSTGYGRNIVSAAHKRVTEITCHAAGAKYYYPKVRSVIDIGGQDSKFIRIDDNGSILDFVMNDKCAAGTGRFLEVMARALHVEIGEFATLSARSKKPATISSTCTVFAESEVISLIAKGETRENIVAGIHGSIASRVVSMMNRTGISRPIVMTGGVARNLGMRAAIEKQIGMKLDVPEQAQVCGAIGAAILGAREITQIKP